MRVTIRQIAEKTHVSTSTVSRVLNNYAYVDEATRSAVLQVAQELGYPIANPRRVPRVSRSILMLVRSDGFQREQEILASGGIESAVSSGMQPVFDKHGIAARVQRTRMDPAEALAYANDLSVAGLVFIGGIVNHDLILELQKTTLPFVVVGAHVRPLQVNCVVADYLSGMQQVVAHLASTGRRRIGLVNGPTTTTSSAEKYKGFRLALALHHLEFDPARVIESEFDAESGYSQTLELLKRTPDVDALAYAIDQTAIGGLRALKECGRRVPDDVAVTGFYGYNYARFTEPPLTSVQVDFQTMGGIAAHRLCMLLQEPDPQAWELTTPTTLIVRASSLPGSA